MTGFTLFSFDALAVAMIVLALLREVKNRKSARRPQASSAPLGN